MDTAELCDRLEAIKEYVEIVQMDHGSKVTQLETDAELAALNEAIRRIRSAEDVFYDGAGWVTATGNHGLKVGDVFTFPDPAAPKWWQLWRRWKERQIKNVRVIEVTTNTFTIDED